MAKPAYDYRHRQRRKALLPKAYGQCCPMCGVVMLPGMDLELDHSTPVAYGGTEGDRIVHGSCNARAGQRIGARTRRLKRGRPPRRPDIGTSGSW
jgi:hypothetical protein